MPTPVLDDLDFSGGGRALGLPTPVADDEAAPKSFVEDLLIAAFMEIVSGLDLKQDKVTFARSRWAWNDFHSFNAALSYPFTGSGILGGAISGAVLSDPIRHPGVLPLGSSANANSGYRFMTPQGQLFARPGLAFYGVFATPSAFANVTTRIGFHDTTSSADANYGVGYLEILPTGVASFKTANDGARTTNAATYTMATSTWYAVLVEVISTTEVRCRVFDDDGVAVLDVANATDIPSDSDSVCLAGVVSTKAGTTAGVTCLILDYMGFGPAKPDWLPV
jgi:hypothetical protein